MAKEKCIHFGLLGTFSYSHDKSVKAGRKTLSFLQYLVVNHGRSISAEELFEQFWAEGSSQSPRTALRRMMFTIRGLLEEMFPDNTPKEREYYIARAKGAVCIMQIGDVLGNGKPHDGRAPDYDDWALNADIIVYYPVLDIALELSSMGIRVDRDSLLTQLEKAGCMERAELPFHKAVIDEELPFTIGGGIGQSRICMFFLRKAHIGEVQCSLWPDDIMKKAEEKGLQLL